MLQKMALFHSFLWLSNIPLYICTTGFLGDSVVKNPPANAEDVVSNPESGISPGEGNGIPSSILGWEIPWTEGTGGLQSMRSPKSQT